MSRAIWKPRHSTCRGERSWASTLRYRIGSIACVLRKLASSRPRETWTAALDLLDEAERQYIRTPVPDVRPIGAIEDTGVDCTR